MKPYIHFSPDEARILDILEREREPISTTDLMFKLYKDRPMPTHAGASVLALLGRLARKTLLYEPYRVRKSERCGPYPIRVWLERNRGRRASKP